MRWKPKPGIAFANVPSQLPPDFSCMPMVYLAFGKPGRFLWLEMRNVLAKCSLNIGPWTFERLVTGEQLVDFAVAEAESLAKAHGLQPILVYHGDVFHARKYLPQQKPS